MATTIQLPQLGESVHEGTLGKWLKKVGDKVDLYDPLVEITTDKVDTEMPSPVAGTLLAILVPEGTTVQAGTAIAVIGEQGERLEATVPPAGQPQTGTTTSSATLRLSPVVARMVAEHNLDPRQIKGTGDGGRITKQDVLAFLAGQGAAAPVTSAAPAATGGDSAPPPQAAPAKVATAAPAGMREERIPLSTMRRSIAEHMIRSRRTSAHVTAFVEVDMTRIVQLRERHKDDFERRTGVRLTYMPFIAYAAIRALKDFPIVNSMMAEDAIVVKHYVNLGIAVALEDGLIVPVIKNADEKSLQGLARDIEDLARRAREKGLTPDDVQGGTFTITNPGVFGTILGTPIINQPQAAILDVEAIVKRPVVITTDGSDSIAIRSMMNLGLSFDHRIIDGAIAARFLGRVKQYLEEAAFGL